MRPVAVAVPALLFLLLLTGCLRPLRFDAARLERRCGLRQGSVLDAETARCVACLAGMRESRRCPLRLEPPGPERATWLVEESCSGLRLELEPVSGRIASVGSAP